MKTTTMPPLRVSTELRAEPEAVLEQGETLSSFVLEAVNRSIEYRKARREFVARGLASANRARKSSSCVSPFSGRKVLLDNPFLRELIIPFASVGYVALFEVEFEVESDSSVNIIAVRHQREDDYH